MWHLWDNAAFKTRNKYIEASYNKQIQNYM